VPIESNNEVKLLKFPIKAIPEGPTKYAITFEERNPVISLTRILKLLKEVTLNN
jgi:hypothetical protein